MADIDKGQALDWSMTSAVDDGGDFRLVDPGVYPFTVTRMERKRFQGSAKMDPCPMAELTLAVTDAYGEATVRERLYLSTKSQWRIARFFEGIGSARDAEDHVVVDWSRVEGAQGWLELGVRSWTGNDGRERQGNEVKRYLKLDDPAVAQAIAQATAAPAPGAYQPQAPAAAPQPAPQQPQPQPQGTLPGMPQAQPQQRPGHWSL